MRALDLANFLHAKRDEILEWTILVADVLDLEHDSLTAYRIESLELAEEAEEIRFIIEYPEELEGTGDAMSVGQFIDRLLPLASDNPDFVVEGSIKVSLMIGGMRWERYGMPLRQIKGCIDSRLLLLGVEGLKGFKK